MEHRRYYPFPPFSRTRPPPQHPPLSPEKLGPLLKDFVIAKESAGISGFRAEIIKMHPPPQPDPPPRQTSALQRALMPLFDPALAPYGNCYHIMGPRRPWHCPVHARKHINPQRGSQHNMTRHHSAHYAIGIFSEWQFLCRKVSDSHRQPVYFAGTQSDGQH